MKASICLSTHNTPHLLKRALGSIYAQTPPFGFETIVVDDGPKDDAARDVCDGFPVLYHRIERKHVYRNPCVARNVGFKMARGDIIIAQSDDVEHKTPDCIERLVCDLKPGHMLFANVVCEDEAGNVCGVFTGPTRQAPYFFLGSLARSDLYAVGGNDEEFIICPAYDDDWFGDCLTKGRGLTPEYATHIVGHHLYHKPFSLPADQGAARALYTRKVRNAKRGKCKWEARGGPWPYVPQQPYGSASTEEVFTAIHRQNHWGEGEESASGAGSSADAAREIRKHLPRVIRDRGIKSMLDIPCGDWHWMRDVDLSGVQYTGADIVAELVDTLAEQHTTGSRSFRHLDLLTDDLPKVDLVFCRDCLVHFSHEDVARAMENIARSGSEYLLATTFPPRGANRSIATGDWTPYNLQAPPFNLPKPLEVINEDCREYYPDFNDKSLALWRIADICGPAVVNSLVVCVEYDDFLAITLPRNKQHFGRTLVVTSPSDTRTQELAKQHGCECYVTDAFYRDGATFNKGAAIEEAFDVLGRDGWICIWDADIAMPPSVDVPAKWRDCLYVPSRRLLEQPETFTDAMDWRHLKSPTQPNEFDGYWQLFHADAPIDRPWYGVDWAHAGGGDSDFSAKFPESRRMRCSFDVLHLGPEGIADVGSRVGKNWLGRVTPRLDGEEIGAVAVKREAAVREMVEQRQQGLGHEKIAPEMPRTMAFFWEGRMSWMRYLTLATFRKHNPDWKILLYAPGVPSTSGRWRSHEVDDSSYHGHDYREEVVTLGIERRFFGVMPGLASAQACDLFQWWFLGDGGGFYADMDILWLKPLEPIRMVALEVDALFCLEDGHFAIGFCAARKGCRIFRDIGAAATELGNSARYQGYGTEMVSRTLGDADGERIMHVMRERYPELKISTVPDETVYPYDWREVDAIFTRDMEPPEHSYGLHWFGGSVLAQEWNRKLTPDNYMNYHNTFTNCVLAGLDRA